MDGFEGKTERVRYDYPFAEPPEPGTTMEVAPGACGVREAPAVDSVAVGAGDVAKKPDG
jgi:hypothetical protein